MNKKLLRKKLALMLSTLKKKRKFFCEVEYLECTGTQGINTGIIGNLNTSYEIIAKSTITGSNITAVLFGSRSSATSNNIATLFPSETSNVINDFGSYTATRQTYTPTSMSSKLKFYNSKNKRSVTNLDTGAYSEATTVYSTSFSTPNNLYIGLKTAGYADVMVSFVGYVYACKIWDNGVLVRDFIPVLDWNYTPCMYDKVSGELFYNQGTGDFSYGREIHYVDYLESTGTQYINTGIIMEYGDEYVCDFEISQLNTPSYSGGYMLAAVSAYSGMGRSYGLGWYKQTNQSWYNFLVGCKDTTWYTSDRLPYPQVNTRYKTRSIIDRGNIALYVNGNFAFNDTYTDNITNTTYPLAMFARNSTGSISAYAVVKAYSLKMFKSSNIVRDYLPAIDENGVGFMFDRVSHTIYDNAGTGVFKYPVRETEYTANAATKAYIDLGVKYKPSMTIEGKYTRDDYGNNGSVMLLTTTTTQPLIYLPALSGYTTERYVWRRPGYSEQSYMISTITYPFTCEMKVDAINDVLTLNGNVVKTGMIAGMNGYDSPYESDSNMYMFSIISTYSGDGKVYYLKITDGTTPLFDLIPAYKDGEAGFYNKVNGTFYKNASTDSTAKLTAGKIIEPEFE